MGRRLEHVTVPADIWLNEALTLEERAILCEIWRRKNHARNNAKSAWLCTNNSLAFFAKISERKIVQILSKLEHLNYIVINNKGNRGRTIEITTHETTHETTQNLRGLSEKIKEKEKRGKKEKGKSKQASIKKEINNQARAFACEDYDEIFEEFCVNGRYRNAIIEFIRHLQANGTKMINSRLERLIIKMDLNYGNDDVAKVAEITEAIASGYKRLPSEYGA